jgi:DNA-binding transcriptional ArsR family regulator
MDSEQLNRVFGALSDPIRRGILERLARGETNISTLAAPFAVSQPAVSKHLRVLERAGLIVRTRQGREYQIRVNPLPIEEAQGWIGHYARFWRRHFDAVDAYLKKQEQP